MQHNLSISQDNIKPITTALAKLLDQDATTLASTLDTENQPPPKSLATQIEDMKSSLTRSRVQTKDSRLKLTQEATKLLALYHHIIETSIRILEQTIHGSVARGTKAKADYLATVAEGMSKKLGVQYGQLMAQVYSPEVQAVLQSKRDELEARNKTMKRKVREAEEKLDEYRVAGGMESVAKEYAEILKESERIKSEIARLKDGKKA